MGYDSRRMPYYCSTRVILSTWVFPFLLASLGVTLDYVTTQMGLQLGFYEAHPRYSLVGAFLFYELAVAILHFAMPEKIRLLGTYGLASTSYFAAIHNILVILGLF
jgi:hypothetical protein